MLTSRDEYCNERFDKNRLACGFEFKCVFGSRFEYGHVEYAVNCVVMQCESVVSGFW